MSCSRGSGEPAVATTKSAEPRWAHHRVEALQAELESRGFVTGRHSYSILALYGGAYAASIHVYPFEGLCIARVYRFNSRVEEVRSILEELLPRYCTRFILEYSPRE